MIETITVFSTLAILISSTVYFFGWILPWDRK